VRELRPAHEHQPSLCLQAKSVDEGCQRSRLLAPARIVEEVTGERLAPLFEHPEELSICEIRRGVLLHQERQADAIDRGSNQ
jgi:hypothetical protein